MICVEQLLPHMAKETHVYLQNETAETEVSFNPLHCFSLLK